MNFFQRHSIPVILLSLYAVLFLMLAFNPFDRAVWFAENATVWVIVATLTILYWRGIRFSNTAYVLMSVLIIMHTIGGHYTFERVPFGWFSDLFGFERNHYDRIAHFTVGFYAFGLVELMLKAQLVRYRWVAFLFSITAIMAIAAGYELFEWWYAVSSNPTAGAAVLGSQGDMWDAQKDMLADTLGAFTAILIYAILRPNKKQA